MVDFPLWVSVANHRMSVSWKNTAMTWGDFFLRLEKPVITPETYAEYMAAAKPVQAEKKDVGGYVGGTIRGGRRLSSKIMSRSLLTLDIDFASPSFWSDFKLFYHHAAVIHGTHKYNPETPRYRLVMPLSREVAPDEYQALSRKVAGSLGIDLFDDTTFQVERLMYWPSVSRDGKWYYERQDGPILDVDKVLGTYKDWTDSAQWPISSRVNAAIKKAATKQGDPLEKPGVIGAFCREHSIHSAIETYLKDVYAPTDHPDRFTYAHGSTASGLVCYEDRYAFSHHGTDPISGKLCNSFDLVRLHLFGELDEDTAPETPINRKPSFLAMSSHALKDGEVSKRLSIERLQDAGYVFDDGVTSIDMDWLKQIEKDKKGNILSSIFNVHLILNNDPYLKDCFAFNAFENMPVVLRDLPWRDIKRSGDPITNKDDPCLRAYLERNYSITGMTKIDDGLNKSLVDNTYHPVKDFLNGLTWDTERRIDTLLIDYFGAEDTPYVRAVMRKTLIAAVARIYSPGCKYDNLLVLISPEGKNKSTFLEKLGRKWFSSDFGPLDNMTRAQEQLQGSWIIEIAELAGIKKSDIELVKHFLSKTSDKFRGAYQKLTEHFPRQCIFIATANKPKFITDAGDNRRFWPVQLLTTKPCKDVWVDLTSGEVNQIWAEAVAAYKGKEVWHLDMDMTAEAARVRDGHRDEDDRNRTITEYLDMLLPENWREMDFYQRQEYRRDTDRQAIEGVKRRHKVSVMEVWTEVFNGKEKDGTPFAVKFIREYFELRKDWEDRAVKIDGRTQRGYIRIG